MQRAVAKLIGMKSIDRAHAELSNTLDTIKDVADHDGSMHDDVSNGILYYQVQMHSTALD
jgi:hypothetical protein